MSLFVLDTDVLSLYQRGHEPTTQQILARPLSELAITVISVEEQLSGWYRVLRRSKRRADMARAYQRLADAVPFLSRFQILSFSEPAIIRFEQLLASKLQVRRSDLRIAAIAQEHGGTVVTRNVRDFGRVPGLAIEDWTQ